MKFRSIFAATLLAIATVGMMPTMSAAQTVNQRLKNQNKRIDQGVKNGKLTRNQTKNLRAHDKNIHSREMNDKKANKGHLTGQEKKNLQKSLNKNSRRIYRDKHDPASKGH